MQNERNRPDPIEIARCVATEHRTSNAEAISSVNPMLALKKRHDVCMFVRNNWQAASLAEDEVNFQGRTI